MSTVDEEAWPEGKLLRRSDPASRQCSASSLLLPSIASPVSGALGSHLCTLGAVVGVEMTCCRAWLQGLACSAAIGRRFLPVQAYMARQKGSGSRLQVQQDAFHACGDH